MSQGYPYNRTMINFMIYSLCGVHYHELFIIVGGHGCLKGIVIKLMIIFCYPWNMCGDHGHVHCFRWSSTSTISTANHWEKGCPNHHKPWFITHTTGNDCTHCRSRTRASHHATRNTVHAQHLLSKCSKRKTQCTSVRLLAPLPIVVISCLRWHPRKKESVDMDKNHIACQFLKYHHGQKTTQLGVTNKLNTLTYNHGPQGPIFVRWRCSVVHRMP